jgi:hypothetical protein
MRQLRRTLTGLAAAGALIAALSGCAAPGYIYAADGRDQAFFKVPSNWGEVKAQSVAEAQSLLTKSLAGEAGGTFTWSRAYADGDPPYTRLLSASSEPVVYASVQNLRTSLRGELSFDLMRDLLFPETPSARQQAAAEGAKLTGFQQISFTTFTTKYGLRGINELYEYDIGGLPDAFDQTVLTNTGTTKLYLLLVQCYQACFLAHRSQIATVINSFVVRGS